MAQINDDYLKLPGSYLFADIAHKVNAFKENHPEMELIRLGIGDVTRPLPPSVIKALHKAVDEQATAEGFRGYGPEQGYRFLREAIAQGDFASRGVEIDPDDIFVSDGAKCDLGNFQELFGRGNVIAVTDPVYPARRTRASCCIPRGCRLRHRNVCRRCWGWNQGACRRWVCGLTRRSGFSWSLTMM